MAPPGVVPPFWPSVKSQTLPEIAAANDVGLAAAALCAWSSVGKFSIRQYSGPDGNPLSFFSATGLTTNCPGSAAMVGDGNDAMTNSETTQATTCQTTYHVSDLRGFIASLLDCSYSIAVNDGAERLTDELY